MNLIKVLIYQACLVFALRHAYLEALLHKAFDPLFGSSFLDSFIGAYEFDPSHSLAYLDLIKWNRKAVSQSSSWLPKLNQSNFGDMLKIIYAVVGCWKEMISEEQKMRHEDVVEECTGLCVVMCAYLTKKGDERIGQKVDSCQSLVYVVYSIHHRPNQTGYFAMLNAMNEQLERLLIPSMQASVDIVEYEYEKMNRLAVLVRALSSNLDLDLKRNLSRNVLTSYAQHFLRIASYSRFIELCRKNGTTPDLEIAVSNTIRSLNTLTPAILELWLSGKIRKVLWPVFRNIFKPVPCNSMEMTVKAVKPDTIYPLPLSIKWEFGKKEKWLTPAQVICCLVISQSYSKFAHELRQLHISGKTLISEKMAIQNTIRDKYLEIWAQKLSKDDYELLQRHALMLTHSMEYNASIVHFSKLPVDTNNGSSRRDMGRAYLQRIAWWINEVTKSVPASEREDHLKMMLHFVNEEVICVIPFKQRESVKSTIVLMISGGLSLTYKAQ